MKRIVESDPVGILHLFGLEGESAEPFDAELSTVSPAADYILQVRDPHYLAHFEFVASYKTDSGRKMLYYDGTAFFNHGLPIYSVLVLLRPEADGPAITGTVDYGANTFVYRVVRLWEMSPEDILDGPAALYPLAPLTYVAAAELPDIIRRMKEPIEKEPSPQEIWDRTKLLLGLKLTAEQANAMLKGVTTNMWESTTFQEIYQEGQIEGIAKGIAMGRIESERELLLRLGVQRFGKPKPSTIAKLDKIALKGELDRLVDRLLKVESWNELMK